MSQVDNCNITNISAAVTGHIEDRWIGRHRPSEIEQWFHLNSCHNRPFNSEIQDNNFKSDIYSYSDKSTFLTNISLRLSHLFLLNFHLCNLFIQIKKSHLFWPNKSPTLTQLYVTFFLVTQFLQHCN